MKVTAAVLRGRDQAYSLEQLELDEPGPGEVLVRILPARDEVSSTMNTAQGCCNRYGATVVAGERRPCRAVPG